LKWSEGQGVDVELVDNFNAVGYVVKYLNKVKEMCVVKGDKISIEVIPYDKKSEGVWKAEGVFMIPNSPPRITSEPETKMEGGKFRYAVKAEDPDGDPIEFTLKDAPKGMSIDPKTGLITWDFDEKDAGEYRVEVIASDPEGAKSSQMHTLTIPKAK
jgi:translation initiation factor IF-1